ncbi:chalcone isomerase family protein [Rugamonas sp.]|uniref:chalcone isomerase family protein n=1 Tax=Rugamonas sp. TaxID=1926287 RepID=UPI0025EE853C|nr:chalcone isomerase family protein [Rugamonas sp.]
MRRRAQAWGGAALLALAAAVAQAAPASATASASASASSTASAPALIAQQLPDARLAGQGVYTWFGLTIYQAQLWVGPQGYRGAAPDAAPFVLDLRYARTLNGRKIADASADQMRKIGAGSEAQRAAWLQAMRAIFPDVTEGMHISGVYSPGAGTRFYLDGRPLGEVPDPAFARAFFGIWLDPASTDGDLRTALLRDAAPSP